MSWCDTLIGALIVMVIWFLYQPQINDYMNAGILPAADSSASNSSASNSSASNSSASNGGSSNGNSASTHGGSHRKSKSGFTASSKEPDDPYTKINKFIDYARGARASDLANGSLPPWQVPGALERYHQSGALVRPEDITLAESHNWASGLEDQGIAKYDTELAFDSGNDAVGYHKAAPVEYNEMITNTVLGARARENHAMWAESMIPWAGVSTSPDTLDEALEATTNFIGLRRPQPIAQYNALQVTERDTMTFLGNHKFNFQG
jgi:hypothetical protein